MIEKHKIIKRISRRNGYNPTNHKRDNIIRRIILRLDILIMNLASLIRINDIHKNSSQQLDNQKLKYIFLASISKIFSLLPVCQLVWFLTVVDRPEMMDLFLFAYHYCVHFLVLHLVLKIEIDVPCLCHMPGMRTSGRRKRREGVPSMHLWSEWSISPGTESRDKYREDERTHRRDTVERSHNENN